MIGRPAEVNITRYRGDTWGPEFAIQQSGAAYDITDHSFKLSVNPSRTPADATAQEFQVTGSIVDATGGIVKFPLGSSEAALDPGTYYYDVQETDDAGAVRTIIVGTWTVTQDITK